MSEADRSDLGLLNNGMCTGEQLRYAVQLGDEIRARSRDGCDVSTQ